MSFTHKVRVQHTGPGSQIDEEHSITAGSEQNVSEEIADSTTDALVAFTCDFSQLKMLTIYSQYALTVCTNDASTGAPAQTIAIAAGVPYTWIYGSGITCPITTDITALYVSNASGSASTLQIRTLEDPTA